MFEAEGAEEGFLRGRREEGLGRWARSGMRENDGGLVSGASEAVSEVWPFFWWFFDVGLRFRACAAVVGTSSAAAKRSLSN